MSRSPTPTYALMKACMPTTEDKLRIARTVGKGKSLIYKWTEDPLGSGRPNPLDTLEVILDHARLNHPHAAFAIAHRITAGNARVVSAAAHGISTTALMQNVQAGVEKEATEALHAFTAAMRRMLLGGEVDLDKLLKEVEEAESEMERARLLIAGQLEVARAKAGE